MPPYTRYHSLFTTHSKSSKCFGNFLVWTGYLGSSGTGGTTELPLKVGVASGSTLGTDESCGWFHNWFVKMYVHRLWS